MSDLQIEIVGLDKLTKALGKFPNKVRMTLARAGQEAAKDAILPTKGLQNYPPLTSANRPPTPYYIRGRGTQYKNRNNFSSERLGTQWYVKTSGLQTKIGNRASYAKWVHDDKSQASWMKNIGWRTLLGVAREKLPKIKRIYQAWVDRTLKQLGLT